MDAQLRSDKISLQLGYDSDYDVVRHLWQTLRKTAVEPGQSSHPDYHSFADECLLCARITTNEPETATQVQNEPRREFIWHPDERLQDLFQPPTPPPMTPATVGLVYLHAGPANLQSGEANIGVITKADAQRRGYAREAVQLVLRWAFEELKFHRVQATILDTSFKDRALRLFIGAGFTHEGTKRRAVYQPEGEGVAGVWKDVTYLAMLDTEWVLRSSWARPGAPVATVWDEMFARHAREREGLLLWEERHGRMRRTSSVETLRDRTRNAVPDLAYLTDDASSIGASVPPSPRPNLVVTLDGDVVDDFGPDVPRQRWEQVVEASAALRHQQWAGSSLNPSLHGAMLALPSIPSAIPSASPSPVTIPTPSSPGSTSFFSHTPPPFEPSPSPSPSPSPAPSPARRAFSDAEDERNWLLRDDPFVTPHDGYPCAGLRSRSRSSSESSSSDSWSDAQSSVDGSTSSWDVVSDHDHDV